MASPPSPFTVHCFLNEVHHRNIGSGQLTKINVNDQVKIKWIDTDDDVVTAPHLTSTNSSSSDIYISVYFCPLHFNSNIAGESIELLENSLKSSPQNVDRDKLIFEIRSASTTSLRSPLAGNNNFIDVWSIPAKMTPSISKTVLGRILGNFMQNLLLDPGSTPSGKTDANEKFTSVNEAKFFYQFVPNRINTVFMIGSNSSGKSLLLRQWEKRVGSGMISIKAAKPINKDEKVTGHGQYNHKPISVPDNEIHLVNSPDSVWNKIMTNFSLVTDDKWTLSRKVISSSGNYTLFFSRNDHFQRRATFTYGMISDGLRQIFTIILHLHSYYHPNTTKIITFDEPESHLHPALYINLVNKILLPLYKDNPVLKVVIATHNFHIISSICANQNVESIVLEIASYLPSHYKDFDNSRYTATTNGRTQEDESFFSEITATCRQTGVFLRSDMPNRPIFSAELLQDMTNQRPIVLYCEGGSDSLDQLIYSAFFDSDKVEVRTASWRNEPNAAKNCTEVREKVGAARKAKYMLNLDTPVYYYGIRDRDRDILLTEKDLIILPLAEIENILWHPNMWSVLPVLINYFELKKITIDEAKVRSDTALTTFLGQCQKTIRNNYLSFVLEYLSHAIDTTMHQTRNDVIGSLSKKTLSDKINTLTNMKNTLHDDIEPYLHAIKVAEIINEQIKDSTVGRNNHKFPIDFEQILIDQKVNNAKALKIIRGFSAMACGVELTESSLRDHCHLINCKAIPTSFAKVFDSGSIDYNKMQPKPEIKGNKRLSAKLEIAYMLATVMNYCGNNPDLVGARKHLLMSFKTMFASSAFPTHKLHYDCSNHLLAYWKVW